MRKSVVVVMCFVLIFGTAMMPMTKGHAESTQASQKWVKLVDSIKNKKISPFLKNGFNAGSIKVIVQTNVDPIFKNSLQSSPEIKKEQERKLGILRAQIKKLCPRCTIDHTFTKLFTGYAISGPSMEVKRLTSVATIQSIHPVLGYKALGIPQKKALVVPSQKIGANQVWKMKDAKGLSVTGKGIKVGVVDTGVDYTHPDLKRNYKGGYNVIGKNKNPKDGHGHGTHVAGIIAANGKLKGIAPGASIYAYRVLNNKGQGTNVDIIAGIEKAAEDKVDVLNLSLGSNQNTPDDPLALALNRVTKLGITVAVANGNDGPNRWTVGTPATAEEVISVGASSLPSVTKTYSMEMINPKKKDSPLQFGIEFCSKKVPVSGTRWEVVDVGLGSNEDYKGKNVRGKMVYVRSGTVSADILISNAIKFGASAIMSETMWLPKAFEKSRIAVIASFGLNRKDLKEAMKDGSKVIELKLTSTREGEEIAYFSSRGMVQGSWAVKPDLVAPGVQIKSTVLKGKYDSWDGTSMASPHVAGAAALLKQKHRNYKPKDIKAALCNTAKDLVDPTTGKSYHVKEQGAGRIDLPRAMKSQALVTTNSISFGLIRPKSGRVNIERDLTIRNVSRRNQIFNTVVELRNGHSGTKISVPSQLKVSARSTKSFTIKASINSTMPRSIYTGRIFLRSKSGQYVVPFTFCIDPKSYSRINYLDPSEEFISLKGKKSKSKTEVSYYVPHRVKNVKIYLSSDKLRPTMIHEKRNVESGWNTFMFDGKLKGKPLADGLYDLEAVARDGAIQESTSTTVFVYSNAPRLKILDKKGGVLKFQVEHELAVLSHFINSFLAIFGAAGEDWVKVQYQLQGSSKWISVPLGKGKLRKKKGTEDDLSGKIELNVTLPYQWMKGKNNKITLRATDKAGNQMKMNFTIPK